MIIKEGEESAYEGEKNIACPVCGFDYTCITDVTVFEMDRGEDGLSYALKPGDTKKDYVAGRGNPSMRRGAVSLHFRGECGHEWITDMIQHKGITMLRVTELKAQKKG